MNKLMAFYRANKGKGAGIVARAGDEPVLLVYDVIVSSDADAEWLGGASAESFVRALQGMNAPRVHVRINSPGGDAFAGIAMANAIRAYPGEVVVHVDGYAASAAGFLTAASERVVMAQGAMIMVHKAWTIALGNADDLMKQAAVLEKLDGQQAELFAGKNKDYDWPAALSAETWFTADEAIAVGLATEKAGDAPAQAKALAFDLTAFDNAPQAEKVIVTVVVDVEDGSNSEGDMPDDEEIARRTRVARALALQVA
jgi:ATP-dependent Clp protease, protease subunit